MIGTSDQSCWLAKTCKFLLILLLLLQVRVTMLTKGKTCHLECDFRDCAYPALRARLEALSTLIMTKHMHMHAQGLHKQ